GHDLPFIAWRWDPSKAPGVGGPPRARSSPSLLLSKPTRRSPRAAKQLPPRGLGSSRDLGAPISGGLPGGRRLVRYLEELQRRGDRRRRFRGHARRARRRAPAPADAENPL